MSDILLLFFSLIYTPFILVVLFILITKSDNSVQLGVYKHNGVKIKFVKECNKRYIIINGNIIINPFKPLTKKKIILTKNKVYNFKLLSDFYKQNKKYNNFITFDFTGDFKYKFIKWEEEFKCIYNINKNIFYWSLKSLINFSPSLRGDLALKSLCDYHEFYKGCCCDVYIWNIITKNINPSKFNSIKSLIPKYYYKIMSPWIILLTFFHILFNIIIIIILLQ